MLEFQSCWGSIDYSNVLGLRVRLDWADFQRVCIYVSLSFFSFFFSTRFWNCGYCSCTVQWIVTAKFDFSNFFQSISAHRVLFTDLQISLFSIFFIKNGSQGTNYTFKNYFATMFFSFQFQFLVFSCIQTDPKTLYQQSKSILLLITHMTLQILLKMYQQIEIVHLITHSVFKVTLCYQKYDFINQ